MPSTDTSGFTGVCKYTDNTPTHYIRQDANSFYRWSSDRSCHGEVAVILDSGESGSLSLNATLRTRLDLTNISKLVEIYNLFMILCISLQPLNLTYTNVCVVL